MNSKLKKQETLQLARSSGVLAAQFRFTLVLAEVLAPSGGNFPPWFKYRWGPPWAPMIAQLLKNLPATQESPVQSLGREDPLKEGMATHGQTMLAGCGPRGHKELDTTRLSTGQHSVDHPGSCGHLSSQDSGNDSRNLPINCGKFCGSSHGNSSRKNLGIWRLILYLLSWWGRVVRSSSTDQSFRGGKAGLGEETMKPGANGPSRKRKE